MADSTLQTQAGQAVMRAIVQDVYGSADCLRLAQTGKPVIAAGEVLVQVRAAGVDRGTCHLMRGQPYLMRITSKRQADLQALRQHIEAGHLTPIVGRTYSLPDVPEAIRHLESGHAQGKIAITV